MTINTFDEYIAAVKHKYEHEKSGIYAGYFLNPRPAQLRDLCLMISDKGLSKVDEETFQIFFNPKTGDSLRKGIEKFDVEKFRPFRNFMNGKSEKINQKSLEVIAVMVDFRPRPLKNFIHRDQPIAEKEETKMEGDLSDIRGDEPPVAKKKKKNLVVVLSIALGFLFVGYIVKNEVFPAKKCLQWSSDHYEEVICDGSLPGAHIIPQKSNPLLLNLRKVEVHDTTRFFINGKPLIWYSKQGGEYEFFNAPGQHPITQKPLLPITRHIIIEHILTKKTP